MSEAAMRCDPLDMAYDNVVQFKSIRLKKDGTPKQIVNNKRVGEKSEVYAFNAEDAHKVLHYFADRQMWIHYLMFVAQTCIARRNGDMLSLRWKNFYNPDTGRLRSDMLEIREEKTGKYASPHISEALKDAITLYIEKTGCDPSENNYENPVFMQLSGTHKGRVMSYDGCRKAVKKAAQAVGIDYNVATHSMRKTFGATALKLNPNDPRALEMVSGFYNHANTRVTEAYTGRTKETVDGLVDEIGDFMTRYVVGDEQFSIKGDSPVIAIDSGDLRAILQLAYESGRENADCNDPMKHIQAFASIMEMVEQATK